MEQETIQDGEVDENIRTKNINENLNLNDELTLHNEEEMIVENDNNITYKRRREEDEGQDEWTEVVRRKQRLRALREGIQLTVTSKTIFPKQFALAKLFKAKNISNISKVKYINPFKITIEVNNEESADDLINCDHFIEMGWRFQRPFEVGLSYGIIKDIELDITEEDLIKSISCTTEVINVKRLQRKNKDDIGWSDCEKVRVGFKGSSLPTYIYIFDMKVRVEPYVFPVTQCSNCWRYGHTRKMCPSVKSYCPKCGGKHDSCNITVYKCINCNENHMVLDRTCPVYIKERRIRDIMAEFNWESIKLKIQNSVQICVEWIITWIFHNIPDWSFLLRIFDDKNK
ncbi:unnamed protein product [Euphydryas editha]|uniref:Reverse transcriptase n=1 Tax=Euphydryas editha TaxID=104508 RepID=A0AAU9U8X1_EUPED|nr:unnamed protein product [Euphydryas editha]